MGIPPNHARDWLQVLFLPAISVCVLASLTLSSSISLANEFEELSVAKVDGEYKLRVITVLDAHLDYVYNVITNYKHAYRINPTITEVEILPSGRDGVVRVRNQSEHYVGPFGFKLDWVGDIVEPRYGYLKIKTIPELSSFKSGSAVWEFRSQGERTWVLHESSMKPDFFMPPIIGDRIMKKKMKESTLDTFNRIECYAKVMFELDMENEPEQMNNLLQEGKNCINSQDKSSHLSLEQNDL